MDLMSAQNKSSLRSKILNKQQFTILVLVCYGTFWGTTCYSMIAPFFPKEAEAKGATPSHYGLILSAYQLMYLVTLPIFSKFITCLSPDIYLSISLLIESISYLLFGFILLAPNGMPFIGLSFLLRIIGGICASIFYSTASAVVLTAFPDQPVFISSVVTTITGLGLILGPTIGGALYQWGGFIAPFEIMGLFLMLGSILIMILKPSSKNNQEKIHGHSIWRFIFDTGVILDSLTIFVTFSFVGFTATSLEPHLRQFNLEPVIVGSIFIISAVVYGITSMILGKLCDRGLDQRKLSLCGNVFSIIGYLFIGPQIFITIDTKLWLVIVSLVFLGLGKTASSVSAFGSLFKGAFNRGFPDDMSTYGIISAVYLFCYSVGSIVGSTLGGYLLERVGYREATLVLLAEEIVMAIIIIFYILSTNLLVVRRNKLSFVQNNELKIKY